MEKCMSCGVRFKRDIFKECPGCGVVESERLEYQYYLMQARAQLRIQDMAQLQNLAGRAQLGPARRGLNSVMSTSRQLDMLREDQRVRRIKAITITCKECGYTTNKF